MIQSDVEKLLDPLISNLGYELWGCEYLPQGRHSLLRVYIDKEGGINVGDCERVSKQVGALLDVEDPIAGNYSLEVSSPGIPRPLFYKRQYQRYLGRTLQIKLLTPVNGSRKFSGIMMDISNDTLTMKIDDEQLDLQFSNIAKAYLTGE